MNLPARLLATALVVLNCHAFAQTAASSAPNRTSITQGVKSVPKLGAPGPVVAWGPEAFPILTAGEGKSEMAVAAASTLGKGRVVIFGHTGYVEPGDKAEVNQLLANAVRWCTGKQQSRLGFRGGKRFEALEKLGFTAAAVPKLDAESLRGCDVVILSLQQLKDGQEAEALERFVKGGGGLIAGVTGWAFSQTNGGKDFHPKATGAAAAPGKRVATDGFQGNVLLADAGLSWTDDSIGGGSAPLQVVSPESRPMLNAETALRALSSLPGSTPPGAELFEQATHTIALALESMPEERRSGLSGAVAALWSQGKSTVFPAPTRPIGGEAADVRAQAALQSHLWKYLPPALSKPHPAASDFPKRVAPGAKAVIGKIAINPAVPGWQSTGLYADAGAPIVVRGSADLAAAAYEVRIGSHSDELYKLDKWRRMPEITLHQRVGAGDTRVANPFGGLVYIVVPEKAKDAKLFEVTIEGAVEAPLFVLGKTTDEQWKSIKQRPAPWAELACDGVILTVPTEVAREVENPTELMKYWQKVVDAEDELSHVKEQRKRPERIVADVQISAGFMHSGYPIMIHLPEAKEMVTVSGDKLPGWGFYHELGHNHQKPEWTPEGTTEVTCNIFSLYITEVLQGRKRGENHGAIKPEARAKRTAAFQAEGKPFEKWKGDPFLALDVYMQLIDGFGWETMKTVLRSYQEPKWGALPKSEQEKRDQWMTRYSYATGRDLAGVFEGWGIPISPAAREQVSHLESWMPPGS